MKLLNSKNEVIKECQALDALCGIRIDKVQLDCDDLHNLENCRPKQIDKWATSLSMRFHSSPGKLQEGSKLEVN